jgi:orotate phosphoribosyltransferase
MNTQIKQQIITLLLQRGIIKTNFKQPITFKSGIKSPIYCNFRETTADHTVINLIMKALMETTPNAFIQKSPLEKPFDIIMGVHSGAATYAERLDDRMKLPSAFVRPNTKPKEYGLGKVIEGAEVTNQKVLLIEDLVSTGGSLLENAKIIKDHGAKEVYCLSLFTYKMPGSTKEFLDAGFQYQSLLNIYDLMPKLEKELSDEQYAMLIDGTVSRRGPDWHRGQSDRRSTSAKSSAVCSSNTAIGSELTARLKASALFGLRFRRFFSSSFDSTT